MPGSFFDTNILVYELIDEQEESELEDYKLRLALTYRVHADQMCSARRASSP